MDIITNTIDLTPANLFNALPPVNQAGANLEEVQPEFVSDLVNNVVNIVSGIFSPNPGVTPPAPSDLLPQSIAAEGFNFPAVTPIDRSGFDPLTNIEVDGFLPAPLDVDFSALDFKALDTTVPNATDDGIINLDFDATAIINRDDRVQVTRPDARIGRVVLRQGGYETFGTGTIVGRFTMITNAHVVEGARFTNNVKFIPGDTKQGNEREYTANRLLYWNDSASTPWKDDFAIVTFSEPIGDRFGWFGYTTRATVTNNFQETARLTGYSGDRWNTYGTPSTDYDIVRGDVAGTANDWTHRIDTAPGASGSALVSFQDQRVLGVHWGGNTSNNRWTPLNRDFFDWIQRADREAAAAYARR